MRGPEDALEHLTPTDETPQAVDFAKRYRRLRRRLVIAVVSVLIAVVVATGVLGYFVISAAMDAEDAANAAEAASAANQRSLAILRDATTPGGEIFDRGQAAQAEAIRTLIDDNRRLHNAEPLPPASPPGTTTSSAPPAQLTPSTTAPASTSTTRGRLLPTLPTLPRKVLP